MRNQAEELLGALERRGFVVMDEHGSLQVDPSDRLTLEPFYTLAHEFTHIRYPGLSHEDAEFEHQVDTAWLESRMRERFRQELRTLEALLRDLPAPDPMPGSEET